MKAVLRHQTADLFWRLHAAYIGLSSVFSRLPGDILVQNFTFVIPKSQCFKTTTLVLSEIMPHVFLSYCNEIRLLPGAQECRISVRI